MFIVPKVLIALYLIAMAYFLYDTFKDNRNDK
jgi:hypothetical protein